MALTRITKGVIKPNENYDTHNINSTGIVTAIGLDVNGNGDISGNLNIGGVLTYEDVTSIDSVGIITARDGIDCNGDIDVDGHTNLDNVSVAGVSTFSNNVKFVGTTSGRDLNWNYAANKLNLADNVLLGLGNSDDLLIHHTGETGYIKGQNGNLYIQSDQVIVIGNQSASTVGIKYSNGGATELFYNNNNKLQTTNTGINVTGTVVATGADINGDLDVDGHTNLDNVNIAGVTTSSGNISISKSSGVANLSLISGDDYATIEVGGQSGAFIDLKSPASDDYDIRFVHDGYIYAKTNINLSPTSGYVVNVNKNLNCAEDLDVDGHTNLDNVNIAGIATFTNVVTKFAAGNGGNTHLQVLSTGTGEAGIFFDAANGDISGSDYCFIGQKNNLDFVIDANANAGNIDFQRAGTTQVRITNSGEVNIGGDYTQTNYGISLTDTGGAYLRLKNSDEGDYDLRFMTQNGEANIWHYGTDDFVIGTRYDRDFHLQQNAGKRLTIADNGKIGINNTSPARTMDIKPEAGATDSNLALTCGNATGYSQLIFANSNDGYRGGLYYYHTDDRMTIYGGAGQREIAEFEAPAATSYMGVGNILGQSSNDGNWSGRFNLYGSYHAKLELFQDVDDVKMAMWVHSGHQQGYLSTLSNHDLYLTAANNNAKSIIINTDGHVRTQSQPSFAAYYAGSIWNVNANYMVFNTTRHNIGNHYDTSNGRFTAPVAGSYQINFFSIYRGSVTNAYVQVYVNGGRIYGGDNHFTNPNLGSNWETVSYCQVLYLNKDDYVQMYSPNNIDWHGNHWQCFSGWLLG